MRIPAWAGWAAGVFALSLAIRGAVFFALAQEPFFELRMGDGRVYHRWANEIAGGHWIGSEVFYQAPLYPYALAVIYRLFGDSLLGLLSVQVVLGSLAAALLVPAGWRLFDPRVGIGAGLILAVYAPAVFADVTVQKSTFDLLFVSATLALMGRIRTAAAPRGLTMAALGLTLGALILTRENTLVFVPILAFWLVTLVPGTWPRRLVPVAWLAVGLGVLLVPVTVRNASISGDLHLTTSQFGHNFFIGNNAAADGTYKPLLYGRGDPLVERADAIRIVAEALGREPSYKEVSSFYTDRALDYIRRNPAEWVGLLGRKALLATNYVELVDTQDQYTYGEYSVVLRWLGTLFHFGLLGPLALLGGLVTWRSWRRLWPLYAMVGVYVATLLVFYVFGRYRLPVAPLLSLFAAAGVLGLPDALRRGSRGERGLLVALPLGFAVLANWPLLDPDSMRSVTHYNLGNGLMEGERTEEAIEQYEMAIALHTDNAMANHNLGVVYAMRGEHQAAQHHLREALRINPNYAEAHINLARSLAESGSTVLAIDSYNRGLALEPNRIPVWVELAGLVEAQGDGPAAAALYRHVLRLAPGHPDALRALGREDAP